MMVLVTTKTNMTEFHNTPESHIPLKDNERLVVRNFGGIDVINYHDLSAPESTTIDGDTWRVIGTGENGEGQSLAVVENPDTRDLIPIRLDHLEASERFIPDVGAQAVEQIVSVVETDGTSQAPSTIRIIKGAQDKDA